ncbi:uncharacterized protein LOC141789354 [Halichoeres trimaculatus]|uniref:uncharacterized protein LOC141789354 n=1 Tax=Halichoeres trimaculatus TaxID=147232 RepID=UPI003D9F5F83
MVSDAIEKSLGAVLIIAARIIFIECSTTNVTEIAGTNITLKFTFNIGITNESHFAVYMGKDPEKHVKIAEYKNGPIRASKYVTYPKNGSVFCNLTNLMLNHSGYYQASLFWSGRLIESEKVRLIVHQEDTSTVTLKSEIPKEPEDSGSSSSSKMITTAVLVVSPVVLVAMLIWLIWSVVKTKDKQEPLPHQNTAPTIQETVEAPSQVPAPSLIYSVLDFPKRASAVQEVNLSDTEYAAVSYLTEKRGM